MVRTQARPWGDYGVAPRMPKYSPRRYSVGVDLGQANDPTAIAVLEKTIAPPETAMFNPVGEAPSSRLVEGSLLYDLVYLKRPKLGTAYDVIARRVVDLVCELEPRGAFGELGQVTLCVDGTGVAGAWWTYSGRNFSAGGRDHTLSRGWTSGP
jgi:hypothetical protein